MALVEAVDDVAAVEREQRGAEHCDAQQEADVLRVEAEFVAEEEGEQWTDQGAADDDGQGADHESADKGGVGGHGGEISFFWALRAFEQSVKTTRIKF